MKAHNKGFSCTLFLSQLLPSSFLIFSLRSQLTHRSHQLIYKCFAFLKPQVPFIHMRVHWLSCTGWILFYFILFYFFYRALHFCFLSSKLCCFSSLESRKGSCSRCLWTHTYVYHRKISFALHSRIIIFHFEGLVSSTVITFCCQ